MSPRRNYNGETRSRSPAAGFGETSTVKGLEERLHRDWKRRHGIAEPEQPKRKWIPQDEWEAQKRARRENATPDTEDHEAQPAQRQRARHRIQAD